MKELVNVFVEKTAGSTPTGFSGELVSCAHFEKVDGASALASGTAEAGRGVVELTFAYDASPVGSPAARGRRAKSCD